VGVVGWRFSTAGNENLSSELGETPKKERNIGGGCMKTREVGAFLV